MKAERRELFMNYKTDLGSQMNINEEQRQIQRHDVLIDGKKTRMLMNEERNRIQMIQAQKLSNLQALGTSERYTNQLKLRKTTF